jgi:hypothetical protein
MGNKVQWEVLGVWRRDMDGNEDAKLFLKDAGKTAEETVERVSGLDRAVSTYFRGSLVVLRHRAGGPRLCGTSGGIHEALAWTISRAVRIAAH